MTRIGDTLPSHEPGLAEGMPVRNALFVVRCRERDVNVPIIEACSPGETPDNVPSCGNATAWTSRESVFEVPDPVEVL